NERAERAPVVIGEILHGRPLAVREYFQIGFRRLSLFVAHLVGPFRFEGGGSPADKVDAGEPVAAQGLTPRVNLTRLSRHTGLRPGSHRPGVRQVVRPVDVPSTRLPPEAPR